MTSRELIAILSDLPEEQQGWKLMLRCDYGDLIVGGRLTGFRVDGFHEHINLVGPVVKDPPGPSEMRQSFDGRCLQRQTVYVQGGYLVQQCNKELGHDKRHSFSTISPLFELHHDAIEWLKVN